MNPKTSAASLRRFDASETIWFNAQARQVRAKMYETRYPQFMARTFAPLATDIDPDADLVEYHVYTPVGMAKIISSYADDLPRADVSAKADYAKVVDLGVAYGWSLKSARKAQRGGYPLPTKKAAAAKRAVEQKIDSLAAVGDAANNIFGMANQPNVLTYTIPDRAAAGTDSTWPVGTPEEALKDLHGVAQYIVDTTKGVEVPDTMILPPSRFGWASTTYLTGNVTGQTVMSAFKATDPYIKNVYQWPFLETAGAGGTKRLITYRRDPEALELFVPREFEQLDPEKRNLEMVIDCLASCGGVVVYLPLSMAYADGL
jgi:hypothetical protein